MKKVFLSTPLAPLAATICNLLIAYGCYILAQGCYFLENYSYFRETQFTFDLVSGSLMFDTSAIFVTNILYVVLMLFPLHWKEQHWYQLLCKWVFVVVNALALAINLGDSVYFKYTMRRTTTTVFSEFSSENNLTGIFFNEIIGHWYLVLAAAIIIWGMWKLYRTPHLEAKQQTWWKYDLANLLSLALLAPFIVAGIRGGFTTAVRPITLSNANQYVSRPIDAALILNTPFSLYRSIGKNVFTVPTYYAIEKDMDAIYCPVHIPADSLQPFKKKNVVVLIVESFGREYIGALNKELDGGKYKGYTPFVDSLIAKSTTFRYSFCNGRKSIDGMPSILSSIPMFVEPFFLTPSSMNHVTGLAGILDKEGYHTAFFHGAQRGSMGFMAFARSTGFQEYFGREDFEQDKRFNGDKDFDGTWAIWDEPFLQYYADKMGEMKQPFMTAVFTASSHNPYVIPEKYKNIYPEEGIIIHKCIRYTDMALRKFFENAKKQPWYNNTIFVLTSDHTNLSDHKQYQTDIGGFASPIILFEPGSNRQPEIQDKVAQQIDILPTVLGMLNYPKPYFGFGIDVLNTPKDKTWAVNYLNGIYQYVRFGYVLQFDGNKTKAIYALEDKFMSHNLLGKVKEQAQMEKEVKAIIQQYMYRMVNDKLTYK